MFEPFTEPCEYVDADLGVLWVESEQKLHYSTLSCLPYLPHFCLSVPP